MWLAAVRDTAIVLLALESIVIGVLLALMLLQIRKLVSLLRDEIAPILDSANDTMQRVQTTTDFVSDSVVHPLIRLRSYTEGSVAAARDLFSVRQRMKRRAALTRATEPRTPTSGQQGHGE